MWRGLADVRSRAAHGEWWTFMERPLQVKASHTPSSWTLTTLLRAASHGENEAKAPGIGMWPSWGHQSVYSGKEDGMRKIGLRMSVKLQARLS